MSVRHGVVGIVYRKTEGKVEFLVLHRVFGWKGWEFPKGGVEKYDKTEEDALLREIKEETGLSKIRIGEKLPHAIKYKYPKDFAKKYRHTETEQHVFLVRAFEDKIKTPQFSGVKEHDDYKWLSYEEARKQITHENQKEALDDAWKILCKN